LKLQTQTLQRIFIPNMTLFLIFPPFLQECEGSPRIRDDLMAKLVQEKPSDSHHQQSLLDLEHVCCHECLAWVQRYYTDIPYLKMRLDQVMRHNMELERDNRELRFEIQQSVPRANNESRKFGDIIIKRSTNVNAIMRSEMHESSFSNV
jgi:hypothetical protein